MPVKSIRFSDELVRAVEAEAKELDRSFSWVVVKAVEAELRRGRRGAPLTDREVLSAAEAVVRPEAKASITVASATDSAKSARRAKPSVRETWAR